MDVQKNNKKKKTGTFHWLKQNKTTFSSFTSELVSKCSTHKYITCILQAAQGNKAHLRTSKSMCTKEHSIGLFFKETSNLIIGLFICLHMAALKQRQANRFIEKGWHALDKHYVFKASCNTNWSS